MKRLIAAAILAALIPAPAVAGWTKVETANFRIFGESGEGGLKSLARQLEDYDQLLRKVMEVSATPPPNKLDVYVVGNQVDLRDVSPHLPASIGGFYHASVEDIAAFSIRGDGWAFKDAEVLFHEYAHHFVQRYFPAAYPAWYSEGFAEYLATARFSEDRVELGRFNDLRASFIVADLWLPTSKLLAVGSNGGPRLTQEQRGTFYSQSWLMVHYLLHAAPDRDAFARFMAEREKGGDEEAAFTRTIGMSPAAFDKALRAYAGGRLTYVSLARASASTAPVMTVERLPAAAGDLLLLREGVRTGIAEADQPAMLEKIRRRAARYPDDPFAQGVLARAELSLGDATRAVAILDPIVARSPHDAELLYLLGLADQKRAASMKGAERAAALMAARGWFGRAHQADPNHVGALYRYAEATVDQPLTENTMNVLRLAHNLAPQVDEITVAAGVAMLQLGRKAEAHAMLDPIAGDPHGGSAATYVRRVLADGTPPKPFTFADDSSKDE